jgi:hypothetical protein
MCAPRRQQAGTLVALFAGPRVAARLVRRLLDDRDRVEIVRAGPRDTDYRSVEEHSLDHSVGAIGPSV